MTFDLTFRVQVDLEANTVTESYRRVCCKRAAEGVFYR